MQQGEYLFPLPSVKAFIGDKLTIHPMTEQELPDMDWYSDLGSMASDWVNQLSDDDDGMISELIYWHEREHDE